MNTIYLAIIQAVKDNEDLFNANGLVPFKHFDKYKGQYEEPDFHQPYDPPALFYEWDADWESVSNLRQRGKMRIRLHIVLENYGESADGSPDQDYALQIDTYYEILHSIVQGLGGDAFTRLNRVRSEPAKVHGYVYPYIVTYETKYDDNSADYYRNYEEQVPDDIDLTGSSMPQDIAAPAGDSEAGFLIDP